MLNYFNQSQENTNNFQINFPSLMLLTDFANPKLDVLNFMKINVIYL